MAKRYEVIQTVPSTYRDKVAGIVNGVLVTIRLVDYDEAHEIRIPSLDTAALKKAAEKLLAERDAMAALGE